ncbi:AAA family ATPase [Candidatus Chloroploca asiatica]|uniref:Orc1-like AAA ATPase domain-containing protein n=1 Tax=Candidatus Chloroploca asiatica TaxID=1506545 RepID=A0A2H3KHA9_9CHLR|nr:ATP-binding protein [Candidatus Chloroploca asiatica]PDV97149.1 hypothetical protein A9Q02_19045 [Candidatus Chloroploca asiatica]
MITEVVIAAATEAVFGYLLSESGLATQIRQRLQPDPLKAAFKQALTDAFHQFAQTHPDLVASLFDEHLLTQPAVAKLLAQSLRRDNAPDGAALAALYVEHVGSRPERRATLQAAIEPAADDLLTALRDELRTKAEFQALFDSQAFDQMAKDAGKTAIEVAAMRQFLEQIVALLAQPSPTPEPTQPNQPVVPGTTPGLIGRAPRDKPNPFIAGIAVPPERFYGRAHERQAIRSRIGAVTAQSISLVGHFRSGKSSLLEYIDQRITEFCSAPQSGVVARISLADSRHRSAQGINEGLRRAILKATGEAPWQQDENNDTYALEDGLERLARQGRRTILLIDEFQAFDDKEKFYEWGRNWRSQAEKPRLALALVVASHRPIPEIYKERLVDSPFGNLFTQERLHPLEPHECLRLLRDGFATNNEQPSAADEALVAELAGGWPFYIQLAASLLWELNDHAAVRREFACQARPHFERLWKYLHPTEQAALRAIVSGGSAPGTALQTELAEQCLLSEDGQIFSRVFAEFIRGL